MSSNATDALIEQRIRQEARVVGLRGFVTPSLEAVERRRIQLWIVTAIVLVGFSVVAVLLSFRDDSVFRDWITPGILRVAVVGLAVAFCAYAIEKELHMWRLSKLLIDERVLSTALSNRLHEVSLLLEAGKAMNSVLDLDAVLDRILGSALELLEGTSGSIMLVDGEDELMAVCVRGNDPARAARQRFGEGIAGEVAVTREPLLIKGEVDPDRFPGHVERALPVDSAMCVPLVSRDELLGVLNVNADGVRTFTEYDLRALSMFAEQAAGAIANARLYEAERAHVAELLELDRMKSEFIALVSHELRTPLTSVLAATETAKRAEMASMRPELLDIIDRQAHRLAAMVEKLLVAARLEGETALPVPQTVDLCAVVRLAAKDSEVTAKPVVVHAPSSCIVDIDPETLRHILDNLVENAYKYGAPPVEVAIDDLGEMVVLSVIDHGDGIPPEDRERVFERFARLDAHQDQPGIGLGLPIVRGLVKACGGEIQIDDAPRGTTVRISFPKRISDGGAPAEDDVTERPPDVPGSGADGGEPSSPGVRHRAARGDARAPREGRGEPAAARGAREDG